MVCGSKCHVLGAHDSDVKILIKQKASEKEMKVFNG